MKTTGLIHRIDPDRVLMLGASAVCLGQAWLLLMGYSPFRSFLWTEAIWKVPVEFLLSVSWNDYVTGSGVISLVIILNTMSAGILLVACIGIWWQTYFVKGRWIKAAFIVLAILALLEWRAHFLQIAQLLEHFARVGIVYLCYLNMQKGWKPESVFNLGAIFISATFIGHGFYALNIFPRPGHFVDMTILILQVTERRAVFFLLAVGIVDLVAALGIFVGGKIRFYSLYYLMAWGLLTALARIVANFYVDMATTQLLRWLPEVLIRLPHFLLPFYLWIQIMNTRVRLSK